MGSGRFLASLGFVLVVLFGFVNVGQVWALGINPSSPMANQSFQVSGLISFAGIGDPIGLTLYSGTSCSIPANQVYTATTSYSAGYSFTVPGQVAGQYSVFVEDTLTSVADVSGCFQFTITSPPPIPEYPYGLPILAILIILGYSVIKRKTRNKLRDLTTGIQQTIFDTKKEQTLTRRYPKKSWLNGSVR